MKRYDSCEEIILSIITVCLNSENTIIDTLNSIRGQTNHSFEYIVVDGGSIDETTEILKKNRDIISVLASEPDKGIFDAMNKGFRMSSGRFILYLNSDDYLELNAVEKIINAIKNLDFDENYIVSGVTYLVKLNKSKIRQLRLSNSTYNKRFKFNPFIHTSSVVSRDVYVKCNGFDCNFLIASDYDFFLRACSFSPAIILIDDIISNMREGGASDVKGDFGLVLKHQVELFRIQLKYISLYYALLYFCLRLVKILTKIFFKPLTNFINRKK